MRVWPDWVIKEKQREHAEGFMTTYDNNHSYNLSDFDYSGHYVGEHAEGFMTTYDNNHSYNLSDFDYSGHYVGEHAETEVVAQPPASSGTGVWDDTGRGRVWRDNAWVKATKYARYGVRAQLPGLFTSRSSATAVPAITRSRLGAGTVTVQTSHKMTTASLRHTAPSLSIVTSSFCSTVPEQCNHSGYNGACETLGMDEICALLLAA